MATKKIRELTYDDQGKNVILREANGDRNSGVLTAISFSPIQLAIGGDYIHPGPDDLIEIVES